MILDLWGRELADEIGQRFEGGVELLQLGAGIYDEAPVSILARATVGALETESGRPLDLRRFRPNVVLATAEKRAFEEDAWVGRSLRFGAEPEAATVAVTLRDLRCVMINFDPDTAAADASVLKTAVRLNDNYAGRVRDGPLSGHDRRRTGGLPGRGRRSRSQVAACSVGTASYFESAPVICSRPTLVPSRCAHSS